MAHFRFLLVLQCLWVVANCFGIPNMSKRAYRLAKSLSFSPLPPSQDPFYTAPPNFAAAVPGTILRIRPVTDVTKVLQNCSSAYNILYRTTDSQYQPTWAVTTLYLPFSSPPNASSSTSTKDTTGSSSTNSTTSYSPGSYLLSYQTPYDSANVDLSPSYTVYGGILNSLGIPTFLGKGWYVNVPDYEGPNASFTAGVQSGHATLDSVRAALNAGLGLTSDVKYAMAGYSGGALASEWATELQVQYAPALHFSGVSLGGLTPNATSVLESVNQTPLASLIVNAILGLMSQWPSASTYILSQLNPTGPYNSSTFLSARTSANAFSGTFSNQNIADYFTQGISTLNNSILLNVVNQDAIMGYHGVPRMPIFAYKAIHDEVSVIADTDALIARFCGVGADILYERNTVGTHGSELINGVQRQLDWLTAAFEGTLSQTYNGTSGPGAGCSVQNVTVSAISTS